MSNFTLSAFPQPTWKPTLYRMYVQQCTYCLLRVYKIQFQWSKWGNNKPSTLTVTLLPLVRGHETNNWNDCPTGPKLYKPIYTLYSCTIGAIVREKRTKSLAIQSIHNHYKVYESDLHKVGITLSSLESTPIKIRILISVDSRLNFVILHWNSQFHIPLDSFKKRFYLYAVARAGKLQPAKS